MLVLFDIDGTLLIRASSEHAAAVRVAIEEVWGVPAGELPPIRAAGCTDVEIARRIVAQAGVEGDAFDAGLGAFREASVRHYARLVPDDLARHRAPGSLELLEALASSGRHRLSLVTGNLEPVAHLKLGRAGMGGYFARGQGGFGSDSEDRDDLPPLARARAGAAWNAGEPWPRERTVIVGDTPRDIACARADGVAVVAVPTGPYGRGELEGADAIVETLADLEEVLAALAG